MAHGGGVAEGSRYRGSITPVVMSRRIRRAQYSIALWHPYGERGTMRTDRADGFVKVDIIPTALF